MHALFTYNIIIQVQLWLLISSPTLCASSSCACTEEMSVIGMLSMTNEESSRIRYRARSVRTTLRRCHVRSVTHAHKERQQLLRGPDQCHISPDWRLTNACAHHVPMLSHMHPFCRTCSMRHLLQNTALELQLAIRDAREDVCHGHHWPQPQGRVCGCGCSLDPTASSSEIRSVLSAHAAARWVQSAHRPHRVRKRTSNGVHKNPFAQAFQRAGLQQHRRHHAGTAAPSDWPSTTSTRRPARGTALHIPCPACRAERAVHPPHPRA